MIRHFAEPAERIEPPGEYDSANLRFMKSIGTMKRSTACSKRITKRCNQRIDAYATDCLRSGKQRCSAACT